MDVSRYFAGVFLKVEDLEATGPMKAKIVDVSMGRYDKPDLTFDDGNKLSVNATNGRTLARVYGYETNNWIEKEVELFIGEVQYQGNPQASILIKPSSAPDKNKAPPTKRADDMNDSITF